MKRYLIFYCPWGNVNNTTTLSGIPFYLIDFLKKNFDLIIMDTTNINSVKLDALTSFIAKFLDIFSLIVTRLLQERSFQMGGVHIRFNYIMGRRLEKISRKYNNTPILTVGFGATRFYRGNSPVFNYIDGTFSYKINYHVDQKKLTRWERYNIFRTDMNGIKNSTVILCSSEIVSLSIERLLKANNLQINTKLAVTGIGANIPERLSYSERTVEPFTDICFIYTNFYKKGGDVMLKIAKLSGSKNYRFHFIGKIPDIEINEFDNVIFHGFIDKKLNLNAYLDVIKICAVNLMPTKADLTPHVICECNAYGIPTIANNIGGIKDLIGKGGILIEGLNEQDYLSAIEEILMNIDVRSKQSFEKYLTEQRWSVVSEKISEEINSYCVIEPKN